MIENAAPSGNSKNHFVCFSLLNSFEKHTKICVTLKTVIIVAFSSASLLCVLQYTNRLTRQLSSRHQRLYLTQRLKEMQRKQTVVLGRSSPGVLSQEASPSLVLMYVTGSFVRPHGDTWSSR